MKMERFTGEGEIVSGSQWIAIYEETAELFEWTEEWKRENFHLHLGGEAHAWYCAYAGNSTFYHQYTL